MANLISNTEPRQRVLDAAEALFSQRGYTAVTLRDIAAAVGIRHASLYHHVPGGKEQLFIEVTERNFKRHYEGLTSVIQHAEPRLRMQLYAAADWLLSQPPMDLVRMIHSDMPIIDQGQANRLSGLAYKSLIAPIEAALQDAHKRGEIAHHNLGLVAGGLLGMIENLYAVPEAVLEESRQQMARHLIDVLLDGLHTRG